MTTPAQLPSKAGQSRGQSGENTNKNTDKREASKIVNFTPPPRHI